MFDRICALVGLLWLLDWLAYLPLFSVFFGDMEARGYLSRDRRLERKLHVLWLASAAGLIVGNRLAKLAATLFFFALYRHYHIDRRWSSVRRGGGAPGFMNHWAAFSLLLLQASAFLDGSGWLSSQVLWMVRIDFAVIMICAGTYKWAVGYLRSAGMEYGRVNPLWGYWWRHYAAQTPNSAYVRVTNALASLVEIAAGLAMLHPATQVAGALAISASFLYVACFIRLGRLAILMSVLPLLYFPLMPGLVDGMPFHVPVPGAILSVLGLLPWLYVAVLPGVKIMQYTNLFANRALPQPWQDWLSRYANAVPIIIWRVFTPDVTNFYLRIYEVEACTGQRRVLLDESTFRLSALREPGLWLKLRFWHVTEAIALVSVFTTLKYFPSERALFEQKLLTYSRSLEVALGRSLDRLCYEYVSIRKGRQFEFLHVGNFHVDGGRGTVREEKLVPEFDWAAPADHSPVRESTHPGVFTPRA